jgi:DNA-binding transcriptional regulator YdaS (Cro superfamily)
MKFEDWVEDQRGEESRTRFLRTMADRTGVSLQTLQFVAKGGRVSLYSKASTISEATGGLVTVPELCE